MAIRTAMNRYYVRPPKFKLILDGLFALYIYILFFTSACTFLKGSLCVVLSKIINNIFVEPFLTLCSISLYQYITKKQSEISLSVDTSQ